MSPHNRPRGLDPILNRNSGEVFVFQTPCIIRLAKNPVMLTLHLLESVVHGVQKIVVGVQDHAIRSEFDDRRCPVDGFPQGFEFAQSV